MIGPKTDQDQITATVSLPCNNIITRHTHFLPAIHWGGVWVRLWVGLQEGLCVGVREWVQNYLDLTPLHFMHGINFIKLRRWEILFTKLKVGVEERAGRRGGGWDCLKYYHGVFLIGSQNCPKFYALAGFMEKRFTDEQIYLFDCNSLDR